MPHDFKQMNKDLAETLDGLPHHSHIQDIPTEIAVAILAIRNAVLNAGPSPETHREVMLTFKQEWPTLYHAIMRLIQVT